MPEALSFKDRDELVSALSHVEWQNRIAEIHSEREDLGPLTAVFEAVGSSTFRAFRSRTNNKPSSAFRYCTSAVLFDGGVCQLKNITSNKEYRVWARHFSRKLEKEWNSQLKEHLHRPQALKLVNLVAKALCTLSPIWPDRTSVLVYHLDVPLDKFSLRPLACLKEWVILRNASMGSIQDRQYERIQNTIRYLCDRAEVPPIAYDFLMWDGAHP